jgi:hypothetical protein
VITSSEPALFRDLTLKCVDCKGLFLWRIEEQKYFQARGFSAPIRCSTCREKHRQERQNMIQTECRECGASFSVPRKDREHIPALCFSCSQVERDARVWRRRRA